MSPDNNLVGEKPEVGKKFSFRRLLFYLISVMVIVVVYFRFVEFKQLKQVLATANPWFLLIAILMQAGTYFCTALNYKIVLKIKGLVVSAKDLYPIIIIIQFLNQALPSAGVSGQIFFIDYLKRKGLTVAEGLARVILELTTLYLAFGLLFAISAFFSINLERLGHTELSYFIYTFLACATFFLIMFLIFQKDTGSGWLHKLIDRFQRRRSGGKGKAVAMFFHEVRENLNAEALSKVRGLFNLAIAAQLGVLLLDIFSLYFLAKAMHISVSFSTVFIVFTLTQFVSMISFVPGSLGVFEGGMSLLFIGFGVDSHVALTLTLIFRALIFWIPMPVGWILYHLHERKFHLRS